MVQVKRAAELAFGESIDGLLPVPAGYRAINSLIGVLAEGE